MQAWIPAFAGMTRVRVGRKGVPYRAAWIPAVAGMTELKRSFDSRLSTPDSPNQFATAPVRRMTYDVTHAGMDSRLRGNDDGVGRP